jgi:DNA-binding NtrC family response regulator
MSPQVLIADDEKLLRNLLLEKLQTENIRAASAENGVEALEILRTNPGVAVLLTDVRMPRMGGYELVGEALKILPELKILMMTGYALDQAPPGWALHAREFRMFRKPFDLDRLTDLLREMLSRP